MVQRTTLSIGPAFPLFAAFSDFRRRLLANTVVTTRHKSDAVGRDVETIENFREAGTDRHYANRTTE